jgi:hypothetical protein
VRGSRESNIAGEEEREGEGEIEREDGGWKGSSRKAHASER